MRCLVAASVSLELHDETFASWLLPVLVGGFVAALVVFVIAMRRGSAGRATTTRTRARLVYAAFAVSIVVLAATSFGTILRVGHMSGYALAAHTAGAGAFVFLLLPFTWWFLPGAPGAGESVGLPMRSLAAWLVVVGGLVVAGTMFASMLPLLATADLLDAVRWHRWSGLVAVIAFVVHAAAWFGTRVARD